jgi:hypothetical protein
MTTVWCLWVVLAASLLAQSPAGITGRWQTTATPWVTGSDAVASPMGAEQQPRIARDGPVRELVIEEQVDAVALERGGSGGARWSLPLSGVTVTARDAGGNAVQAQAAREGAVVIVRSAHPVRLPGGSEVIVHVEERHELLADGTLRVETTAKAGASIQTHRAIYRRAQ